MKEGNDLWQMVKALFKPPVKKRGNLKSDLDGKALRRSGGSWRASDWVGSRRSRQHSRAAARGRTVYGLYGSKS